VALSARMQRVLLDVDGPQLVLATDPVGGTLLCLLTARQHDQDDFLCVPISAARLFELRSGAIDLRSVLESPEIPVHYRAILNADSAATSTLLYEPVAALDDAWLPDPGVLLPAVLDDLEVDEESLTALTYARHRAILEYTLSPPESHQTPVIEADHLSSGLAAFQRLLRLAQKKAIASLQGSIRHVVGIEEASTVEVFGFAPGSFKVLLQSKMLADLGGRSAIAYGLRKLDELISVIDSPEESLEVVRNNRGHLVAAYRDWLEYLVDSRSDVVYTWADPELAQPITHVVSSGAAAVIYQLLQAREELGVERHSVVGVFTRVDVDNGTWTLRTEDNREYRGHLAEGAGSLLSGVTVDTHQYKAEIEERLEETLSTGRQTTKYFLQILQPLRIV
jgi:hypothetical protein